MLYSKVCTYVKKTMHMDTNETQHWDANTHDKQSVDAKAYIITIPAELWVWQATAVHWTLAHSQETSN